MNLPIHYNPLNWRYAFGGDLPLDLTRTSAMAMRKEFQMWERDYIPASGLKGKTVLDVGAGCGETAYLFFLYGAEKVICIEPDPKNIVKLVNNSNRLGWNIALFPEKFKLSHLQGLKFDYAKIDCEGSENVLFHVTNLPPLSVEIHSLAAARLFKFLFPQMRIAKRFRFPLNTWMGFID